MQPISNSTSLVLGATTGCFLQRDVIAPILRLVTVRNYEIEFTDNYLAQGLHIIVFQKLNVLGSLKRRYLKRVKL